MKKMDKVKQGMKKIKKKVKMNSLNDAVKKFLKEGGEIKYLIPSRGNFVLNINFPEGNRRVDEFLGNCNDTGLI